MQSNQRPIGADFEHGALAVRAPVGSRAIEIAVAALHQPSGRCAIISAIEGIQGGQRPIGADLEHAALYLVVIVARSRSRAIQIAVAALHQPTGTFAIIAAGEGMQSNQLPSGADLEDG